MVSKSPNYYADPYWTVLSRDANDKAGLPVGLLQSIVNNGEKSNANQVSEKGAKTPFQITPPTRKAILDKYGIDPYLSDENAAEGAALLLKEAMDRNNGSVQDAVAEYHGGTDRSNWGPRTKAYTMRVTKGVEQSRIDDMASGFAKFMQDNPTTPESNATPPAQQSQESATPNIPQPTENQNSDVPYDPSQNVNPDMVAGFGQYLQQQQAQPQTLPTRQPSLGERLAGAGEAGLSTASGMLLGGPSSMIESAKGITQSLLNGTFGTQQAADLVEQQAARGAQAVTYQPKTELGQQYTENTAAALEPLNAVMPEIGAIAPAVESFRASVPVARGAAEIAGKKTAETAKTFADKAKSMVNVSFGDNGQPPATGRSAGASAVAPEQVRVEKAQNLPVPVDLTLGAASRDAGQLAFEKEAMKNPELGAPLRNRQEENNLQLMQNFDELMDQTGATSPDLPSTGHAVIDALKSGWKQAKNQTRAAYTKARKSPEAQSQVDLSTPVDIGNDPNAPQQTTITDYLNSKPQGVPSSAVTDSIRSIGQKMGIFSDDGAGNLKPNKATVGQLEDFRREINGIAKYDDLTGKRDETIVKSGIDQLNEPVAGPLYKEARRLRTEQAQKFENRAIVARLLENKKNMDDPQVAVDQVFNKSILNSSPEEIRFLKKTLIDSGSDGEQAWSELQGATLKHIRDESSKGMGMDSNDRPIISTAKLHNIVSQLDKNGRLDTILGTQHANIIRDLNDVARYVNTVPPGTLINNSGTAGMIMAAMAEAGATGALTGLPVPVISLLKTLVTHIKNNRLKAKINNALKGSSF